MLAAALTFLRGVSIKAWFVLGAVAAIAGYHLYAVHRAYSKGVSAERVVWEVKEAKAEAAAAEALAIEVKHAASTAASIAEILARAATAVAQAKAQTKYITREVTRVVESHPELRSCPIPDDLLRLRREQVETSRAASVRSGEGS